MRSKRKLHIFACRFVGPCANGQIPNLIDIDCASHAITDKTRQYAFDGTIEWQPFSCGCCSYRLELASINASDSPDSHFIAAIASDRVRTRKALAFAIRPNRSVSTDKLHRLNPNTLRRQGETGTPTRPSYRQSDLSLTKHTLSSFGAACPGGGDPIADVLTLASERDQLEGQQVNKQTTSQKRMHTIHVCVCVNNRCLCANNRSE